MSGGQHPPAEPDPRARLGLDEAAAGPAPAQPSPSLSRRAFLAATAGGLLGAAAFTWQKPRRPETSLPGHDLSHIEGRIVGPDVALGHRLREPQAWPQPTRQCRVRTLIVGGGVAGLSAAWALERAGWSDFAVLEMEAEAGGTSKAGRYPASACPWGAHYLPLPPSNARAVMTLLDELKVIVGWEPDGAPIFEELFLCHEPQERLHISGTWQEGLFPHLGASADDMRQRQAFAADMERWRGHVGRDGRRAFTVPLDHCSRDPEILALDAVSMGDYLEQRGWTSPRLRWFVEYGCRDDYGCSLGAISAWAGIHYFACRGQAHKASSRGVHDADEVLTWPEGNGFLVNHLRARVGGRLVPRAMALRVRNVGDRVEADVLDARDGTVTRFVAHEAIVAAPRFVAAHVVEGLVAQRSRELASFSYAPWVVANLVLDTPPLSRDGDGAPLCWDNVRYDSPTLGYVNATHQSLSMASQPTVWTHYNALYGNDPVAARRAALAMPWAGWRDQVLADLLPVHPDLADRVQRLDVCVWGHAMVRPVQGFIWGNEGARERAGHPLGRVWFAHTDMSGMALFEEAQQAGVKAAEQIMARAGHRYTDLTTLQGEGGRHRG